MKNIGTENKEDKENTTRQKLSQKYRKIREIQQQHKQCVNYDR